MAKKINSSTLVYLLEGPRKPHPTYVFRERTFTENPQKPGKFEKQYDYTIR